MSHLCSHTFQKHPLVLQNFFKMSAPRERSREKAEEAVLFSGCQSSKNSHNTLSQPGPWRLALRLGTVRDTAGSRPFKPSPETPHNRSEKSFIPGVQVDLGREDFDALGAHCSHK